MSYEVTIEGVTVVSDRAYRVGCLWPECRGWIRSDLVSLGVGASDFSGGVRTADGWCCAKHVRLVKAIGSIAGMLP